MNIQQTREYLKHVFALEGALYTHQKLMDAYISDRNLNVPKPPVKKKCSPPNEPFLITPEPATFQNRTLKMSLLYFCIVMTLLPSCILLLGFFYSLIDDSLSRDAGKAMIFVLLWLAIGIICVALLKQEKKKLNELREKEAAEKNAKKSQQYANALAKYEAKVEAAEAEYSEKLDLYNCQSIEYANETSRVCAEFNEIKNNLEKTLTNLYSQNIIYSKYRNIIAVSTIYEYFDSGRCSELEGPNGAYNMYEGELRSNIIISSLSQIISNLNQIKNNQYALYTLIDRSNREISDLLNDINNTQKLTAYYAEATATAASADRYIVGMVW